MFLDILSDLIQQILSTRIVPSLHGYLSEYAWQKGFLLLENVLAELVDTVLAGELCSGWWEVPARLLLYLCIHFQTLHLGWTKARSVGGN